MSASVLLPEPEGPITAGRPRRTAASASRADVCATNVRGSNARTATRLSHEPARGPFGRSRWPTLTCCGTTTTSSSSTPCDINADRRGAPTAVVSPRRPEGHGRPASRKPRVDGEEPARVGRAAPPRAWGSTDPERYFNSGGHGLPGAPTWDRLGPSALDVFRRDSAACLHHDQSALNAVCGGRMAPRCRPPGTSQTFFPRRSTMEGRLDARAAHRALLVLRIEALGLDGKNGGLWARRAR